MTIALDDAPWFAAQLRDCQQINDAFGLSGVALIGDYDRGCIADNNSIEHGHVGYAGLRSPLVCSTYPACPAILRAGSYYDQAAMTCDYEWALRAVCPCGAQ